MKTTDNNIIACTCATLLTFLAVGSFFHGCGKSTDPDKPLINKVSMSQDFNVTGGDKFSIPIYFENNKPIAALSLPLHYPSDLMRCDSVSFVGGRCEKFFLNRYFTRHDTIQVGSIDTLGVGAGSGLCATLHFWVFGNAPDTNVSIDLLVNPTLPFGFSDTSLTAETIIPQFEAGRIHINSQL
ncbi:MAG: hypothetical protein IPH59_05120 [bacterium]|nr:hypothetical protein [bacterium]